MSIAGINGPTIATVESYNEKRENLERFLGPIKIKGIKCHRPYLRAKALLLHA